MRLAIVFAALALPTVAHAGWFFYDNIDDCVVDRMKGQAASMTSEVKLACRAKFPCPSGQVPDSEATCYTPSTPEEQAAKDNVYAACRAREAAKPHDADGYDMSVYTCTNEAYEIRR